MKVKHNSDGTVTVAIPKGREEYIAEDSLLPHGGLYYTETLSEQDFKDAQTPTGKVPTDEERAEAVKAANTAAAMRAHDDLMLERAAERATAGQPSNIAIVADAAAKHELSAVDVAGRATEAAKRVASDPGVHSFNQPTKAGEKASKPTTKRVASTKATAKPRAAKKAAAAKTPEATPATPTK